MLRSDQKIPTVLLLSVIKLSVIVLDGDPVDFEQVVNSTLEE